MRIQGQPIDAKDAPAVYRLVRQTLREGGAALEQRQLQRKAARRALAGTSAHVVKQSRPPATTGIGFDDQFKNRLIEGYWRRPAGGWQEVDIGFGAYLQCASVSAGRYPLAQIITAEDTYADVDITLNILAKPASGSKIAYIMARTSATYPDNLYSYLWFYDFDTGSYQLDRFENGIGGALAFGNIGAGVAPLTMRLVVSGANLTGYINAVDLTGVVVDGSPLAAGAVGIGCARQLFQFSRFTCTVL